MVWWNGKLYVGTGRATQCVMQATGHLYYPTLISYPSLDPDVECTPDPQDLPLQAEIWRWTPQTDTWEQVFQSPMDIEIPGYPGHYVARDIGFRSMIVFREPDGTEALYAGGASSNTYNTGVPAARILRSTDGVNFEPLPQDPGTFLGDIAATSYRSLISYRGRLYVIASVGYAGFGPVLEATDPAGGNDQFHLALSADTTAFELETFNNFLYIGSGTNAFAWPPDPDTPPFSVLKTNAQGTPPYTPTAVITQGAYRQPLASRSVVSMYQFKGKLYVGTDRPAELLRINADDTWDLVVGTPRLTPDGLKYPLSGMDVGFDNPMNIHIWRMGSFDGQLYVGTMGQSTKWGLVPFVRRWVLPNMGFDLYRTTNGEDFVMLTQTGFDERFDVGVRSFVATPYGLIMGTANHYYGTRVWRLPSLLGAHTVFLPLILLNSSGPQTVDAPGRLTIENSNGAAALSWEGSTQAARFHIFRSDFVSNRVAGVPEVDSASWIPGAFNEIATTDQPFFVDHTVQPGLVYHYYVEAENSSGGVMDSSNLARFPSLSLP